MACALPLGGWRGNLPPEHPGTSNSSGQSVKTKRVSHKKRAYSLEDKENIVAVIESGARNIEIVRKVNWPKSTVRNIKRNLEETKKSIALAKKYYGSDGNNKRAMKDKSDRNRLFQCPFNLQCIGGLSQEAFGDLKI